MTLENLVKIRGMVARFTTRMQLYERLKPQSYTRVKDSSEKLYKAMLDCLISMIKWCKKSKRGCSIHPAHAQLPSLKL